MKKAVIGIIIVLIVIVGIFFFVPKSNPTTDSSSDTNSDLNDDSQEPSNIQVKTFVVDSSGFRFYIDGVENPDIKVKQGDKVKIEFKSSGGFHDWVVDEFNARTAKVNSGNSTSVEFIVDKKGTFEYYCSVGQHRANGMKGNFIVE